jgi:hypothetical protein
MEINVGATAGAERTELLLNRFTADRTRFATGRLSGVRHGLKYRKRAPGIQSLAGQAAAFATPLKTQSDVLQDQWTGSAPHTLSNTLLSSVTLTHVRCDAGPGYKRAEKLRPELQRVEPPEVDRIPLTSE